MQANKKTSRVHIKLQRVQTWLFAVPRLPVMVGANSLLGATVREGLRDLAREEGKGWKLNKDASGDGYPTADSEDPLKGFDDPAKDASEGIFSRDGGHFEAEFEEGAEEFAKAAQDCLQGKLPGLRFSISIDDEPWTKSAAFLSNELPVLEPCEWTGRGLASTTIDRPTESAAVSTAAHARYEAASSADAGTAMDLVTLLTKETKLGDLRISGAPNDLDHLAGAGYLALIHADGNSVGRNAPKIRHESRASDLRERAAFFHRNRVLLRRALRKAIDQTCEEDARVESLANEKNESKVPLVPLMLGGDDLLLVCRARLALDFVVSLCRELRRLQSDGGAEGFELTLGVGVVIAKPKIPIHRLHDIAEDLAGSAKRRYRRLENAGERGRSVVDWAVYTTSWVDDPEEIRRREWLRGGGESLRVLSQRPVDVLGDGLGNLEGLVKGANKLKEAPRSQLRYLADQLPRGRALSELAYRELPKKVRDALKELGVEKAWKQLEGGPYRTELLDLLEVAEIARLGRKITVDEDAKEAAHV